MTDPIIIDYLTQIFERHYKIEKPEVATEAALKFLDILELYQMKLIIGEWIVPEIVTVMANKPQSIWEQMAASIHDIEDSGREPWAAREIQ